MSSNVAYMSIIRDGDLYRAYYRCDHQGSDDRTVSNPRHTAYAESTDGIHWEEAEPWVCIEFNGSKNNNLIWMEPGSNLCVFIDKNPAEPPERRYKAHSEDGTCERERRWARQAPAFSRCRRPTGSGGA